MISFYLRCAVIRVSGQLARKVIAQALRRTGQAVIRESFEPSVPPPLPLRPKLPKKPKLVDPVDPERYYNVTDPKHYDGLRTEEQFTKYLHYQTDEIVIRWGDDAGTHGADIVTVNSKTGRVTLWKTKWRSNPEKGKTSGTFSLKPGSNRLLKARQQAREAILDADHLPPSLKEKAIQSLDTNAFSTHTPYLGPGARSSGVQFIDHPIQQP